VIQVQIQGHGPVGQAVTQQWIGCLRLLQKVMASSSGRDAEVHAGTGQSGLATWNKC